MIAKLIKTLIASRKVADAEALTAFMASRAAFVAQKALSDHFRGYLGYEPTRLESGRDPVLAAAMRACREASFAATLGDVAELTAIYLRRTTELTHELPPVLSDLALQCLLRETTQAAPEPPEAVAAAIASRLARSLMAAPRAVRLMGRPTMERMMEALPSGTSATPDQRLIMRNSIRFLLCRAYADLEAQADAPALARALGASAQRVPRSTA